MTNNHFIKALLFIICITSVLFTIKKDAHSHGFCIVEKHHIHPPRPPHPPFPPYPVPPRPIHRFLPLELKAVKVTLTFKPTSAVELRRFFHLLKFRGLLFRVEARSGEEIRLSLDGPVSLFNQTSRYGLKLATLIPRLTQFGTGVAQAELSWGSHRKRVMYEHAFTLQRRKGKAAKVPLNEILDKLIKGWKDDAGWTVEVVTGHLIETAGQALVPDLKCTHTASRKVVYVELMGFWSRDAVWQRVELVKHLKTPFVFLVSERLRVSEKVLEPSANGALFVFKGVINRKRLLAQLDDLV